MEEPTPKATLGQHISLWSYKLFCLLLRLCDIRLIALCGRCIGYLVWACASSRRRIVARNMRIIMDPTLRPNKLNAIVRRNIVRTTMNLVCSLKTGLMTDREMKRSIHVDSKGVFENVGLTGTAICCVPHAGNWEILGRIRPLFSKVEHYGCMYRRLANPLLEKMVYASRTAYGCEMYSKEDGLRAVLKLARTGGLLGVLSDQFTQEGIFLPYFGKVTGTTPLPALLYKRCKGKGTLFSVFTRNTGLGKWDAVLDRTLSLPEGCDSLAQITMEVNLAIEACQREDVIDGFWMHHRWKATAHFAPQQDEDVEAVSRAHTRLPFRFLIAMPEDFAEARRVLPALRAIKASRFDAQVSVICPTEQQAFWQQQPEVTYTVVTDGAQGIYDQLDADELYKDGPYDLLFMFSDNRRVWKEMMRLTPLYVSGFADNPFAKHRKIFRSRYIWERRSDPQERYMDYIDLLRRLHYLPISEEQAAQYAAPPAGEQT